VTPAKVPEDGQVIVTTPWELVVEAGIVTPAIGPDDLEEGDEH
jgi:hypothetical protein